MKLLTVYNLPLFSACLLFSASMAAFAHFEASVPPPPMIDERVPPPSDNYTLTPDSLPQQSAPAGKTFSFSLADSEIFPGTTRTITIYIPAAYKGDKPACLYIALDSLDFHAPTVFDNLIAQHAMPITIAVGISSGTVASAASPENPRFDRSFEFDSLNNRLPHFILDEVIPEVERRRTPDGRAILLSSNPDDRAIGGASTGGIGAFTVAWERPDAFHRVFTAIGTFVGMRGGEQYYVLVRKTEPKPLRIFMQDGVHDEWPGGPEMGDWWMSNLTMNRALGYAGYDVRHIWGAGTHNGNQAASIFPSAMRWLWRDWPSPIHAGDSGNPVLRAILQPQSDWHAAVTNCARAAYLASDPRGTVFYGGGTPHEIAETAAAEPVPCNQTGAAMAFAFGANGTLYRARPNGGLEITTYPRPDKPRRVLAMDLHIHSFTVTNRGDVYATAATTSGVSDLWLIPITGTPVRLDTGLKYASGIALSPDGLWLCVAQRLSRSGISYRILRNGMLDSRAPFYDFYVPASPDDSVGAIEIVMDRDGRAYAATRMGVQVFDRNGRVTAILPLPGNVPATSLCFGGPDFDTLYVVAGGTIYKRRLRIRGAPPWAAPIKLPHGDAG
jgi:gluconolactonase